MNIRIITTISSKIISKFFFILVAPFILASCNGDNGDSFPQVADPPPFDYVDGEELRSGMHQLAFAMLRLDQALRDKDEDFGSLDPQGGEVVDQREVVENLQRIQMIAEDLQVGDIRVMHPYLASEMHRFLSDVDQAIFDASMRSPRYYMAGRVSGACVSCHSSVN